MLKENCMADYMEEKLLKISTDFAEQLNIYFSKKEEKPELFDAAEDMIRYLFFYACLKNNVKPYEIILEKANCFNINIKKNPKLDILLLEEDVPKVAIEIKYHRTEGKTKPQKSWLGNLIYDFYRLQNINLDVKKISIYVESEETQNVYKDIQEFKDLMNLECNKKMTLHNRAFWNDKEYEAVDKKNKILDKAIKKRMQGLQDSDPLPEKYCGFEEAEIYCFYKKEIGGGNKLRIFEIN